MDDTPDDPQPGPGSPERDLAETGAPAPPGAGHEGLGADPDWPAIRRWRKEARARLIERRLNISPEDRAAWSGRIDAALGEVLESCAGCLIGFYWPFRGEYDPRAVLSRVRERGARLALPVIVERGRPLVFREWSPGSHMTQGVWNVPMPEAGETLVPDILVVPLVGFDLQGYRLGYGGGFYDRTIAAMADKPRTIGVGFGFGRLPTIHPQPHDVALDQIVTEG